MLLCRRIHRLDLRVTLACLLMLAARTTAQQSVPPGDRPLRVWLLFAEPAPNDSLLTRAVRDSAEAMIDSYYRRGIDLNGVRRRVRDDTAFAALLLGQQATLRELASFRETRASAPRLAVEFFQWPEYYARLAASSLTDQSMRPHLTAIPSSWCATTTKGLPLARLDRAGVDSLGRAFRPELLKACGVADVASTRSPFVVPWLEDVRLFYSWRARLPGLSDAIARGESPRLAFEAALRRGVALARNDSGARSRTTQSLGGGRAGPPFVIPTAPETDLLNTSAVLIWTLGDGDLVSSPSEFSLFGRRKAIIGEGLARAAERASAWARDSLIAMRPVTHQELEDRFVRGELASVLAGPWLLPRLRRMRSNWAEDISVIMPPFQESGSTTFLGGTLLGVTEAAVRDGMQPFAAALAWHMASGQASVSIADATGYIPASIRAESTYLARLTQQTGDTNLANVLTTARKRGRTYDALAEWPALDTPATSAALSHVWEEAGHSGSQRSVDALAAFVNVQWSEQLGFVARLWRDRLILGTIAALALMGLFLVNRRRNRHRREVQRTASLLAAAEKKLVDVVAIHAEMHAHADSKPDWSSLKHAIENLRDTLTSEIIDLRGPSAKDAPSKSEPPRIEIVRQASPSLALKRGADKGGFGGTPAYLLHSLVRRVLLERKNVTFSVVATFDPCVRALDPAGPPENIETWSSKATSDTMIQNFQNNTKHAVRDYLTKYCGVAAIDVPQVLATGTTGTASYEFKHHPGLDLIVRADGTPNAFSSFATDVAQPYNLARKEYEGGSPAGAKALCLDALHASRRFADAVGGPPDLDVLELALRVLRDCEDHQRVKDEGIEEHLRTHAWYLISVLGTNPTGDRRGERLDPQSESFVRFLANIPTGKLSGPHVEQIVRDVKALIAQLRNIAELLHCRIDQLWPGSPVATQPASPPSAPAASGGNNGSVEPTGVGPSTRTELPTTDTAARSSSRGQELFESACALTDEEWPRQPRVVFPRELVRVLHAQSDQSSLSALRDYLRARASEATQRLLGGGPDASAEFLALDDDGERDLWLEDSLKRTVMDDCRRCATQGERALAEHPLLGSSCPADFRERVSSAVAKREVRDADDLDRLLAKIRVAVGELEQSANALSTRR